MLENKQDQYNEYLTQRVEGLESQNELTEQTEIARKIKEAKSVDEVEAILQRLAESETNINAQLLAETTIIKELGNQRRQTSKDRQTIKILLMSLIIFTCFAIAGLLGLLNLAKSNAQNLKINRNNLSATIAAQQILIDCTTPGHKCYDDSQKRNSDFLNQIAKNNQDALNKGLENLNNAAAILRQHELQALLDAINQHRSTIVFPPRINNLTPTTASTATNAPRLKFNRATLSQKTTTTTTTVFLPVTNTGTRDNQFPPVTVRCGIQIFGICF